MLEPAEEREGPPWIVAEGEAGQRRFLTDFLRSAAGQVDRGWSSRSGRGEVGGEP